MKHQAGLTVNGGYRQGALEAVVVRCGCGDPQRIHPGAVCPTPRATEDQGTVAYWHANPLMRLWYWIARRYGVKRFWR